MDQMSLKTCNKCKTEKDTKEFNNSIKFGLYPTCRVCISKRRKELKMEKILRVKTELHKIVLVENKILKQDGLSQCHTCRTKIQINKSNHYCNDCIKSQREKDKEKVLASKKLGGTKTSRSKKNIETLSKKKDENMMQEDIS